MKFGEKLKIQREKKGLSHESLAKFVSPSKRTLINYEKGATYPKHRDVYYELADFFGVDVNYFLTENEEFLAKAADRFGVKGQAQAKILLEEATALFAGGDLSEKDKLGFLHDIRSAYLQSKEIARDKYTPKKHKK